MGMRTTTMTDPFLTPATLTLVQWLSPSFPTGAFAYSHGLEQVIADGGVHDADTLRDWISDVLCFGTGWQDAVLLSMALRDGADLDALDAQALALQSSFERHQESAEQGAAFARTVSAVTGRALPARLLPLAVAEATMPLGLVPRDVIALYLQSFANNLVLIGVKHIPIGQSAGQQVLAALLPTITDLATTAETASPTDFGNSCLAADLAAMAHETKDTRIYRT
jgi:urease accessory protein